MRIDIVAAVTPSRTSLMKASRVCIWVPALSRGTCSGTTACRNLKSLGAPWTVFKTCRVAQMVTSRLPHLDRHKICDEG